MIKYRTVLGKIESVEVLRETEKMVVIACIGKRKETREAKRSEWTNWHDTWVDAHEFLLAAAQQKVVRIRMQLERAKDELGNIKGMKVPLDGVPKQN